MEGDFLKNLKKSLDTGKENDEINNIHYELLKKAREKDVENKLKSLDENDNNSRSHHRLPYTPIISNRMHYVNEVYEFLETTIPLTNKEDVTTHNIKVMEDFNEEREKKEKIEMNEANIQLLEGEIKIWEIKISKNRDLIRFLKEENEKYAK